MDERIDNLPSEMRPRPQLGHRDVPRKRVAAAQRRRLARLVDASAIGVTACAAARRVTGKGRPTLAGFGHDARALERRFETRLTSSATSSQLEDMVLSAGLDETRAWPTVSPARAPTRRRGG